MDGTTRSHSYLLELDVMRVILIIGVLYTHTETTMGNATDAGSISRLIFNYTHLMLHFTRMGFVFITGFVLMWRYYRHRFNWLSFRRRRYWRIGIPYLWWITVYLVGIMVIRHQSLGTYEQRWLNHILNGNQFYMYYLYMIAQLYLIFPLLSWLFEKFEHYQQRILIGSGVLQLVLVAVIKYMQPTHGTNAVLRFIFWHYGTNPLMYQLYFVLGAYIAVHYRQATKLIDQYGRRVSMLAISAVVMSVGLYWFNLQWLHLSHHQSESIHQPFMVVMDVLVILMIWWLSRGVVNVFGARFSQQMHYAGQMAFGIYLMQTILLTALAGILRLTAWPNWVYLVLTPIAFGLVFSGTYLLAKLMDHTRLLRPLIGLELNDANRQLNSY